MSKSLMRYKRVASRMRQRFQDKPFTFKDLETAIYKECGTDPRTVAAAIDRMIRLELISRVEQERTFGVMKTEMFILSPTQDEAW